MRKQKGYNITFYLEHKKDKKDDGRLLSTQNVYFYVDLLHSYTLNMIGFFVIWTSY